MTSEQKRAHERLLEVLPRRYHREPEPPAPLKKRIGWNYRGQVEKEIQRRIVELDAEGMRGKDIAEELNVSESTVSRYLNWKRP